MCGFSKSAHYSPNYNRINEWPLQFLRTGYYDRSYGHLASRTTAGFWWSATAGSATYGRYLGTWTGNVVAQYNTFRGAGFALRCTGRLFDVVAEVVLIFVSSWGKMGGMGI